MTRYTRGGAVDYTFNGSELVAEMDSNKAVEFTQKWIDMQHQAGRRPGLPTSIPMPQAISVTAKQ